MEMISLVRDRRASRHPPLALLLLAAVAAAYGCDGGYRGEPLARLGGIINSSVDEPPSTLQAVLYWSTVVNPGGDTSIPEQAVIVSLAFPARFQLELYEPPVDQAFNDFTRGGTMPEEARIGVAHIVAWPADYDVGQDEVGDGPEVYGLAEHHLLIYVDRDIQAGTESYDLVGGELEAGYHLMDAFDVEDPICSDEFDCMRLAPDDLDTEIRIRIDQADLLEFPDWA
jgi:hypothetical protein